MATDDQDLQLERCAWRMCLTKSYWVRTICKTAAWLLTLAIVILSLVPPSYRAETHAPHNVEHFVIFFATGLVFGIGYPGRPFISGLALVIFCAAIEVAQLWIPGRHARLSDFTTDAVGVCIGVCMSFFAIRLSTAQSDLTGQA